MKIGVAYATPAKQLWLNLDMPEGTTVKDAIEKSGILKQFPEIDLTTQKVGIFGKATTLEAVLEEGARVEIYRPMTADPKTVPRRAKAGGEEAKSE
jgi:putative ubiquitin-RnfH superfamily antitoxin RatB of RatAB toxin-antitoxin module